ncbi:MAG TPA: ATP-dependent DNA helicase [Candidatus Dormibacteraeota bacterium]|nr:ATP-dependent DNA helicase [Candidatus Dormibacteraeota bacterium]
MIGRLGVQQLKAASAPAGPVRVVAGAGTGKTAVIAERFRRLVEGGASPSSVLVMTFTERAAAEMRHRIEALVDGQTLAVGTFHSIALGWLREEGKAIGIPPGFRLLTGADRWILARELMWSLGDQALTGDESPDDLVSPVLQMFERLKQELVPIQRLAAWAASAEDRERGDLMRACVRLFRAYERECRKRHVLDFDDLLLLCVQLFEGRPALRRRYASRYPHVLVDEYQDLNLAQERLVELIARDSDPFVVGDDDQSIYRFRGASRASLERFLRGFPHAATVTLGRNRRSSRRIVSAAACLIGNNSDRLSKQLESTDAGPPIEIWELPDSAQESAAIASQIERLLESGIRPAAIAVLCRTNAIARPIASALAERKVPHVVIGGRGFYDLPEIKDVIAMLRVLRDPTDVIALARPAAGSRETLLNRLSILASQVDVRDLVFTLMEDSSYLTGNPDAAPNVSRLAELVADFCEGSPDHSLDAYMRHLELVLLSGEDDEPASIDLPDAVQIMTIHQAKGLEFDAVFVPSLVEGRVPQSARSPRFELPPAVLEPLVRGREDVIAEERRLLYVAMTRARRLLYLTFAERYEGERRWRESRFLQEIRAAGARTVHETRLTQAAPSITPAPPNGHALTADLSYSAITSYRDCPRQFWYRYVQRLPSPQSAEAVHGVVLHEVLRQAGEQRKNGEAITASRLKSIHDRVWREMKFPDERRAPTFKRIGANELEAYRRQGGFKAAPAFLEQPFSVSVDGWNLRGVIDRIDRTASGWRIIDYKSGRPLSRRRRDLQVALYALGAASALNLEPIELEVVYLASGDSVIHDKVDSLVEDAVTEGSKVAAGIQAGQFEPRPERRRCRLCPYRLACSDAL